MVKVIYYYLKNNNGQKCFIETDFDDIKETTCLFADIDQGANGGFNKFLWLNHLKIIEQMYGILSTKLYDIDKKTEWDQILSGAIKEYTITKEKMQNIIFDIAVKNKYFGLPENELIQGIKDKLEVWKQMLDTTIKDDQNQYFNEFKKAMQETLAGLKEFNEEKIKEIVINAKLQQENFLQTAQRGFSNNTPQSSLERIFGKCCPCCFK